ncbi:DUF397 domain-containing protein [Actinomadura rupiterrae]|uniref:DUF397 domain-containing protein n=1 Tax=Actinomadura rupiterrae TaxID=559627 RepID=UPI0020A543BD|nr:DUF397 domain-containing protein [Actinomadura rupiterrae]MCP2338901.1 hypothetical protein [Actinomadura rupiterrae]
MTLVWRKSTYSGTGGSQSDCVEVAKLARNLGIRDSKNADGPRLVLTPAELGQFLASLR